MDICVNNCCCYLHYPINNYASSRYLGNVYGKISCDIFFAWGKKGTDLYPDALQTDVQFMQKENFHIKALVTMVSKRVWDSAWEHSHA